MKKLILLPLLLGMLLTGCGEETNPGGNAPGGDQPVTGTFTFEMSKMGWTSGEENPKITADPGLTIKAEQGENLSSAPKYWEGTGAEDKTLRLYAQNTLTLSANEITKIEFSYTIKDSQTMSPNIGSLSSNIWTGSSSSVTFTLGSKGQIRIIEMKVTGTFSSGGSTPVDPVDPTGEYTPLSVAQDLDIWMWPDDYDLDNDFEGPDANGVVDCKYADWYDENIENTEECLRGILESVLSLDGFPSYLTVDSDIEYDATNSQVYVFYATPGEEVAACIFAMYEDGEIGVSFQTAPYDYYLVEE